mgnify:FL=1
MPRNCETERHRLEIDTDFLSPSLCALQDEHQGRERAVRLPGGWTHADETRGLTKEKLEQYKTGGIMAGTEVKWGKKTPPVEILGALGGGGKGAVSAPLTTTSSASPTRASLTGGNASVSAPMNVNRGSTCTR